MDRFHCAPYIETLRLAEPMTRSVSTGSMPMSMFNQLPGFVRTPAGLERVILRRMPKALLLSTLLPAVAALSARWFAWSGSEAAVAASIRMVDFAAIGVVLLLWTLLLTLAIGAFIVMVMKGPAYVADAYPLVESERPLNGPRRL
jgi:hypothetical protein